MFLLLLPLCGFISAAVIPEIIDEELNRMSLQNPDLFGGDMTRMEDPYERNIMPWKRFRWPDAIVPYVIDASLKPHMDVIVQAINNYHSTTCVRFVPRTYELDYIRLFAGQGCYSHVGMTGGMQPVSLGQGCIFKGTIVHELGHALGFYHEQNRSDRDEYLEIFKNNIQKGMESNFITLEPNPKLLLTPFNYDSIMIYGNNAFSKDGTSITMKAKNGQKLLDPYNKIGMSALDIKKVNTMFPNLTTLKDNISRTVMNIPDDIPFTFGHRECCVQDAICGDLENGEHIVKGRCPRRGSEFVE